MHVFGGFRTQVGLTRVVCVTQDEMQEYADQAKLKELVQKYSEFINFPISLYTSKEVDVPVEEEPEEEEDKDENADPKKDDDVEDEGVHLHYLTLSRGVCLPRPP
jgi:HSP90 family molecular chaperone